MDLETLDLIKKLLNRRLDNVKVNLIYNVDDEKQLMYHRGQIKSLEDLQQDIKDLLNKQEQK
jgi:formiminotetrahydrofolate cyclodeaminase